MWKIWEAQVYGSNGVFRCCGEDVTALVQPLIDQGLVRHDEPWEPVSLMAEGKRVLKTLERPVDDPHP